MYLLHLFAAIPDAPVNLRATRISENFIELEWNPPVNNGGTPIRTYNIEISSGVPDKWVKLTKVSSLETYCKATKLEENMDYFFRVTAENDIGVSAPATTPKAITTKKGLCK